MQTIPTAQSIGHRIQQARTAAGLSLEQLAGSLDVSRDTIERWEKGASERGPSYLQLIQVADLTDRDLGWFATDAA